MHIHFYLIRYSIYINLNKKWETALLTASLHSQRTEKNVNQENELTWLHSVQWESNIFSGMPSTKSTYFGCCAWHPIHFGNYLMHWVICNKNERESYAHWIGEEEKEYPLKIEWKIPNEINPNDNDSFRSFYTMHYIRWVIHSPEHII